MKTSSGLPAVGGNGDAFTVEGVTYNEEKDVPNSGWNAVSPGFFQTFEIKATKGRLLDETDPSLTLTTLARAAAALGRKLNIQLAPAEQLPA